MERNKILNPLTGRMIDTRGATAKKLVKQKQKTSVIESVLKRKLTQRAQNDNKKAITTLQSAIKRKLTQKPKKPVGFEDMPEDVKNIITKYVMNKDNSFEKDKGNENSYDNFQDASIFNVLKRKLKPDINSVKDIEYVKRISSRRLFGEDGIEAKIEIITYTRKDRVEKLRDLDEKELKKHGGMEYYPLVRFRIIPSSGYRNAVLGDGIFLQEPPEELWVRGKDAENCFKRDKYSRPYLLFPDGYLYQKEDSLFYGTLNLDKKTIFGNDNLKIKWREVNEKDEDFYNFKKHIQKYMPKFALPK